MGDVYPINYVSIINRWCLGPHDPSGCLCRLSGVELSLIDDSNNVVATESIGNTCGLKEVTVEFDAKCVTATQVGDLCAVIFISQFDVFSGFSPTLKIPSRIKWDSAASL